MCIAGCGVPSNRHVWYYYLVAGVPLPCLVYCLVEVCKGLDVPCRLWSTKQEQEKVLDEDATKRKQEAADAKVC